MRRIDQFLYQKETSFLQRALVFPLYLPSIFYGWAIRLWVLYYSLGIKKAKRLPCPVISVGNITVGGTGKTPLAMALAKGLRDRGISVAILSRGYKGIGTSQPVVSDGKNILLSPEESGDEPFLMAKTLQSVPVLVGKDRYLNGQTALQRFGVQGFLLDDGYQYLPLHRDLDILLIDSERDLEDLHLLPRGILREPLSHLQRADFFLLTKMEHPGAGQPLEEKLRHIHPSAQIFHSHYEPVGLIGPDEGWEDLHSLKGKKVFALSGIANPSSFTSILMKCGMEIVGEAIFPDHHAYTMKELASIEEKSRGADWLVTTEKDMLKLRFLGIRHLRIRALHIEIKIWEEEGFFRRIMQLFQAKEERKG